MQTTAIEPHRQSVGLTSIVYCQSATNCLASS